MKFIFYVFIFCLCGTLSSQTPQTIKFQKNSDIIYFFPKAIRSDSIVSSANDEFYLIIPDSMKMTIAIYMKNCRLIKTANDSIVKVNYVSGLQYEAFYIIKEGKGSRNSKLKKEFEYISLINGTSEFTKNKMEIAILDTKTEKVVIKNTYIYEN